MCVCVDCVGNKWGVVGRESPNFSHPYTPAYGVGFVGECHLKKIMLAVFVSIYFQMLARILLAHQEFAFFEELRHLCEQERFL